MTSTRNLRGVAPRATTLAAGLAMAFAAAGMGIADGIPPVAADAPHAMAGSNWNAIMPLRSLRSPQTGNRARADVHAGSAPASRPARVQAVTNCDDSGPGSLRDELAAAVSGDTIDLSALACGTITLTSGQLYSSAEYLTIQGPGRDALTIDGNNAGLVLYSSSSLLTIADLTIANGNYSAGFGGCVSVFGDLVLTDSRVTGCSAGDGGNISAYGAGVDVRGNLTLQSSTISGSTASASGTVIGGGAYVGGNAYIGAGSSIEGNHATAGSGYARGGGLFVQGNVALHDSVVSANTVSAVDATAYGGGIHANGGSVGIYSSRIEGNSAHSESQWSYGGGIQAGDNFGDVPGNIHLESSTISGNSTTANCGSCFIQGGGAHAFGSIYSIFSTVRDNIVQSDSASEGVARGGGLATFEYGADGIVVLGISTVSGNAAIGGEGTYGDGYGGGVAAKSGIYALGATIAFNQASTSGGGVTVDDTDATTFLSGSIVANNLAPDSADIAPAPSGSATVVITGDHNLVTTVGADVTLPGDTLSDDPLLLPLASNGGPTATHALPVCSPAVDASTNPNALPFDQRNDPYVRESGIAADIGAFELQPDADRIFAGGFESSPCP